ncbi:MAG: hypothetical protein KAW88_09625 [Candidatus Cloacimonetes bacterium]|nr:hypothetical protein [Candidatus Cloacimonadota bacterium]
MLEQTVGTIILIPLRAVVLWVLSGLGVEQHSYIKALIATVIIFITYMLLSFLNFKGFHGSTLSFFFQGWYFKIVFSFLVLKLIYKFDWMSLIMLWVIWFVIQIPMNILQTKLMSIIF